MDDAALEALARAALDDASRERKAFGHFSLALWPLIEASVHRAPRDERRDEAQEIFARVLERFEADDLRGLRAYDGWKARHPEKTFLDWIRIVLANLSRDRARERLGRRRPETDDDTLPSAKRLLNELARLEPLDTVGYRPPVTNAQTAREILAYAAANLPPLQARALAAWIEGESFEELRDKTGVDSEESALRLVRAALATLRRRFAVDP